MDIRLDPHSTRMIEQQLRSGRYHSPEEVVQRALERLAEIEFTGAEESNRRQAVRDMLEFAGKHKFTLGEGLRIQDLIHEGHKY